MDVDKLFAPFADYLNFVIEFLQFQGLEEFSRVDSVSAKLLSYFVLGAFLGLVIHRAKAVPNFNDASGSNSPINPQPTIRDSVKESLDQGDLFLFIPLLLVGASIVHLSLLIVSHFGVIGIGTYKDTLNATLAGGALQYPIQAALGRAQNFARAVATATRNGKLVAVSIHLLAALVSFVMLYYAFWAIAQMHKLSMNQLWWPVLVFLLLFVVFILILGYLVLLWKRATQVQ